MNYDALKACRLFLLDMDGTLYLGDEVIHGAIDFIHTLEQTGRRYIYLTNNSSRAGIDYVNRLRKLGFPCEMENVFTSGMATGMYLAESTRACRSTPSAPRRSSTSCAATACPSRTARTPGVVCVGFDTTLTYEKLERAVHFIRRGAAFVAANPDWVCPMAAGEVMPDCGSICALLTASTGVKPLYIGKPNRDMVDIISNHTGVPNSVICCVGDRLYTDIAVAVNAGAQSVLVMSGETTPGDSGGERDRSPGWVMADVAELADVLKG